jgi:hypothetical protein
MAWCSKWKKVGTTRASSVLPVGLRAEAKKGLLIGTPAPESLSLAVKPA